MMGSSMLAMPWAIKSAGLFTGVFIVLAMTGIVCYTARIIIDAHAKYHSKFCCPLHKWSSVTVQTNQVLFLAWETPVPEFAKLCGIVLGPRWEKCLAFFSLFIFLGIAIVYWVLMSTFIYDCAVFFEGKGCYIMPLVLTKIYHRK